jgi:hypothetical protein
MLSPSEKIRAARDRAGIGHASMRGSPKKKDARP